MPSRTAEERRDNVVCILTALKGHLEEQTASTKSEYDATQFSNAKEISQKAIDYSSVQRRLAQKKLKEPFLTPRFLLAPELDLSSIKRLEKEVSKLHEKLGEWNRRAGNAANQANIPQQTAETAPLPPATDLTPTVTVIAAIAAKVAVVPEPFVIQASTEIPTTEVATTETTIPKPAGIVPEPTVVQTKSHDAKKELEPAKATNTMSSNIDDALNKLTPFKFRPVIKFYIEDLTEQINTLKDKGLNAELEKVVNLTFELLSNPKSMQNAYMSAANTMKGHPRPELKKLGLIMMALCGAVAIGLVAASASGVAVATVSTGALMCGGFGLFAGQRTGLSKTAIGLSIAAMNDDTLLGIRTAQ